MTGDDLGAYEFELPESFNIEEFVEQCKSGEKTGYWAMCLENEPVFKRLSGVLLPDYIRTKIDLGSDAAGKYAYNVTPCNQDQTAEEVAKRVFKILGAKKMFKDGKEIEVQV
jgi:hypothetical protein